MNVIKPWQTTPTELIKQAIDFLHQDTEGTRQIAFLLLDVGVETLFKIFLLLPETITKVDMKSPKRAEATKGSFHTLVKTVKEAGKDRLSGIDLADIKYYHDIRNKLYHQGDGVIPTIENSESYASIAVELLYRLLLVDLRPLLLEEQQKTELISRRKDLAMRELEPVKKKLEKSKRLIYTYLVTQLDKEDSEFAQHSFIERMNEYLNRYSEPETKRWKSAVKRFLNEGLYIMDDDGNPVMRYSGDEVFIEFVNDILDNNPAGAPPSPFDHYLESFDYTNEYNILEIIMADDITEALLLITNLMESFQQVITVDNYCKMRKIINLDIDSIIMDKDFEIELRRIVEEGKQLLESISVPNLQDGY